MNPAVDRIEKLRQQLRRIEVDHQEYYIAEGDLLIATADFEKYAAQRFELAPPDAFEVNVGAKTTKLIGIGQNGKLVRWAAGAVLSYHIRKETFPSQDRYAQARACMNDATEAWMDVCGVQFRHDVAQDSDPPSRTAAPTLFDVRYFDAGGRFIAAAFFPNDPPDRRRVLIDPSFFDPNLAYDKTGALRHELGHVLGFRHEQIRSGAPPNCPKEALIDTIEITDYDPQSVMHYFCGGVGSHSLQITEMDKQGALKLYGPPFSNFDFVTG